MSSKKTIYGLQAIGLYIRTISLSRPNDFSKRQKHVNDSKPYKPTEGEEEEKEENDKNKQQKQQILLRNQPIN